MKRVRVLSCVIITAMLIFACAPAAPAAMATLGPDAFNTAIAETAAAAAAATNGNPPGLQPAFTAPPANGPLLDPAQMNTAIVQTAAAAATRTAGMIPPTLTPSVTPLPTWTASITPPPTQTFIFRVPTRTNTPRPAPTKPPSGGGGGGGGGHGGGGSGDGKASYSCKFVRVSPANGVTLNRRQQFTTVWTVINNGDTWLMTSADLVYQGGNTFGAVDRLDLTSTVKGGQTVSLPGVTMRAPSTPGTYSTFWDLQIGHTNFCPLSLKIVVK